MSTLRSRRLVVFTILVIIGLLAAACSGDTGSNTPPADAVNLGSTSTTRSSEDPPAVIGGAPGPDGHLPVRMNPSAWQEIEASHIDDDPLDPYHELHSVGHDNFWWGVELHTDKGAGWTGELGLFATDCIDAGICVRFDPDGGAGAIAPLLAEPNGEAQIDQIEGGYQLVFRNLIFRRDDGASYRIDQLAIQA